MSNDTFDPKNFAKPQRLSARADPKDTFNPKALKKEMKIKAQAEQQREHDLLNAPLGPIKTWSFSRLMQFESCPYSVYLKAVEKAPDPSGPAAERGSIIHEHIEGYIQNEHDDLLGLILERPMKKVDLAPVEPLVEFLRKEWIADRVKVEEDWGFTRQWEPTGWTADDVWARMKLDAIHFDDETSAVAYDWKSGRKFGNELKHNQQGMAYAIGAFMRYPELQFVETQFVYVDVKEPPLKNQYTRDRAMLLKPMFDRRANAMTTATSFPAKPSIYTCRWCPHAVVQEGREEPACAFRYQEL